MRPHDTVLLLDADEDRRGRLAYALETKCTVDVVRCGTVTEVAEWLRNHREADVRVLVADARTPEMLPEFLKAVKLERPEMNTLLIGYDSPEWLETGANVYIPSGYCSVTNIYERLRILCLRKRGPKRAENRKRREDAA